MQVAARLEGDRVLVGACGVATAVPFGQICCSAPSASEKRQQRAGRPAAA
jgi:hypothetical protein